PDGHQWDEGALVLAEIEAHAMDARPSLVMEITDALAGVLEQPEHRAGGWVEFGICQGRSFPPPWPRRGSTGNLERAVRIRDTPRGRATSARAAGGRAG